ncbi:MurR/RpiR family transcriptional regulator [Rugosimonospora africana]|nr:MurR/RpiR family transcriptional regulator [Rugosimonospora africana]
MADVPQTYAELRVLLQQQLPKLAAGQQRIAKVLLDDPEGTAFRTIAETARVAEVHESSLVRFATLFGLSGYPALVGLCRQQLASDAQLVRRLEHAQQHTATGELFSAVVEHDSRNLTRTFARIDHAAWERAVELLADAASVHVLGLRKCFSVAHLASYLLHMVRPRVRQIGAVPGLLVDDLRDIGPGDVLVVVGIRRYTADTVRVLDHARRGGVQTIALTDDPSSPLAAAADIAFYVETGGVTILRSLSAFTSVTQALTTAVAVRRGTSTRAELLTDESLLDAFGVYAESAPVLPGPVPADLPGARENPSDRPGSRGSRRAASGRKRAQP